LVLFKQVFLFSLTKHTLPYSHELISCWGKIDGQANQSDLGRRMDDAGWAIKGAECIKVSDWFSIA
jgi:hypothetical protein